MSSTIVRKNTRKGANELSQESKLTDPRENMAGFSVKDTITEIESAVTDSGPYYVRMERNDATRLCLWEGKDTSCRKKLKKGKPKPQPWPGASDQEVHLAQEVLLQLTALCSAAMVRGGMNVTPMEGTDIRAASQMKLVMRYYLDNAMRGERLIQGMRWASWTRRYGHAVLYVGWKAVKQMEEREVRRSELVQMRMEQKQAQLLADQPVGEDGQPAALPMIVTLEMQEQAEKYIAEEATENELAAMVLELRPDLREREKGMRSGCGMGGRRRGRCARCGKSWACRVGRRTC